MAVSTFNMPTKEYAHRREPPNFRLLAWTIRLMFQRWVPPTIITWQDIYAKAERTILSPHIEEEPNQWLWVKIPQKRWRAEVLVTDKATCGMDRHHWRISIGASIIRMNWRRPTCSNTIPKKILSSSLRRRNRVRLMHYLRHTSSTKNNSRITMTWTRLESPP